ncbi:hypothetical protein N7478_011412 [Penicillium angulare]|uniref:uncharacterized protein n=1 Tax=Penicillium angulare TaxID=116970 RepID=UPI0025401127|nr:uncharacterized protein N7478_011412 [Penicillium angulare]KAJ5263807.1 hypothetical protein N7478_011412 [Penicillium angulare]
MSFASQQSISRSSSGFMDQLPPGYTVRTWSNIRQLRKVATDIFESLQKEETWNQWLVVLGLSEHAIERLCSERSPLGVSFRFQWEGRSGLIKIVPSSTHDTITERVVRTIDRMIYSMGISIGDGEWAGSTTYRPTSGKGKESDNCFVPVSRCLCQIAQDGWPTFVIETGLSEGLDQLRQDARRWFAISEGMVRLVLVIGIKPNRLDFEIWQLAPTGALSPLTRLYIDQLCAQVPNIPPTNHQSPLTQQAYCAQEVIITPHNIDGAPLYIPFVTIFDRMPVPGEGDILLTETDFDAIASRFW